MLWTPFCISFRSFALKLSPLDSPGRSASGVPSAVVWVLALVMAAVLLWPLYQGPALREKASQHRLAQAWCPEYRVLPLLGLAHAQSLERGGKLSRQELDQLWQATVAYQKGFPLYLWMELAWLEARAGNLDRSRQALARAKKTDPGQFGAWERAKLWDPWRSQLGLAKP